MTQNKNSCTGNVAKSIIKLENSVLGTVINSTRCFMKLQKYSMGNDVTIKLENCHRVYFLKLGI
jgi:hypothetical protein